mmetsp:Transcript_30462/g.93092  ORF Transcript_30462/g.93092 Transcript_30462/m.93092 type:complete len:212 (-) Transcript_30462:641-1276(-)|eukprot:scaffold108452_cov34-Tisochrysis_lutea.AAC.2
MVGISGVREEGSSSRSAEKTLHMRLAVSWALERSRRGCRNGSKSLGRCSLRNLKLSFPRSAITRLRASDGPFWRIFRSATSWASRTLDGSTSSKVLAASRISSLLSDKSSRKDGTCGPRSVMSPKLRSASYAITRISGNGSHRAIFAIVSRCGATTGTLSLVSCFRAPVRARTWFFGSLIKATRQAACGSNSLCLAKTSNMAVSKKMRKQK